MTESEIIQLIREIKEYIKYIIPIWIIATKLKDWISLFFKRQSIKSSLMLNMDGCFEIDGKKGSLVHFGWRRLTLKDVSGQHHHIPMELVVRTTITRLNKKYKEKS